MWISFRLPHRRPRHDRAPHLQLAGHDRQVLLQLRDVHQGLDEAGAQKSGVEGAVVALGVREAARDTRAYRDPLVELATGVRDVLLENLQAPLIRN